jgi:hypothetical protein
VRGRFQLDAINAANMAKRIADAIAIPQSGSLNTDGFVSFLAAASTRTVGRTLATGFAAAFFRDAAGCCRVAKRELIVDLLLARWVTHVKSMCKVTRKPDATRDVGDQAQRNKVRSGEPIGKR